MVCLINSLTYLPVPRKNPDTGLPYLPPSASDTDELFGPEEKPSAGDPNEEADDNASPVSPGSGGATPSKAGEKNPDTGLPFLPPSNDGEDLPDPAKPGKNESTNSLRELGDDLSEQYDRKKSLEKAEDENERRQRKLQTGGSAKYEAGPEDSQGTVTEADVRGRLGNDPLIRTFGDEGPATQGQQPLPGNLVFDAGQAAEPTPDASGARPPIQGDIDVVDI